RLAPQVPDVVPLQRVVQRALGSRERARALRGQQPCDLERLLEHWVVDAVHEADAESLLGVDKPAGEDEPLRDAEAADAGEPLRAAPAGDDPEVDLGLAELRPGGCVAQVAAERELAAAAERKAV